MLPRSEYVATGSHGWREYRGQPRARRLRVVRTRTTRWRRHRREQTPLVLPITRLIADQCTHQASHSPRVPLLVIEVRIVEQSGRVPCHPRPRAQVRAQ